MDDIFLYGGHIEQENSTTDESKVQEIMNTYFEWAQNVVPLSNEMLLNRFNHWLYERITPSPEIAPYVSLIRQFLKNNELSIRVQNEFFVIEPLTEEASSTLEIKAVHSLLALLALNYI